MILLTIHRKLNQERKDKIGSLQLSILDALQNVYLKTLLYEMDLRNQLIKKVSDLDICLTYLGKFCYIKTAKYILSRSVGH